MIKKITFAFNFLFLVFGVINGNAQADRASIEKLANQHFNQANRVLKINEAPAQFVIGDYNQDGIKDAAAILEVVDTAGKLLPNEKRYVAVAFASTSGEFEINYLEPVVLCLTCGHGEESTEASLIGYEEFFEIKEAYGTAVDREHRRRIKYLGDEFLMISHFEKSNHESGGSWYEIKRNYETLRVVESITLAEGRSKQSKKMRYPLFASSKVVDAIQIDGELNEKSWTNIESRTNLYTNNFLNGKDHWKDRHDGELELLSLWDQDHFYIGIKILDDHYIPTAIDGKSITGDHLNVYLNFNQSIPAFSKISSGKNFDNVIQLAIGFDEDGNGKAMLNYPKFKEGIEGIEVAKSNKEGGYYFEIKIPVASLKTWAPIFSEMLEWKSESEFGCAFIFEDADPDQPEVSLLATSLVREDQPFTYGKCRLFELYEIPILQALKF